MEQELTLTTMDLQGHLGQGAVYLVDPMTARKAGWRSEYKVYVSTALMNNHDGVAGLDLLLRAAANASAQVNDSTYCYVFDGNGTPFAQVWAVFDVASAQEVTEDTKPAIFITVPAP